MASASKKRQSKIARQKQRMRDTLWPELDETNLWSRSRSDGWLSLPRPMPLIMKVMDSLSKGKPVSATYLDLWCRTYDDSFVIVNKEREMAYFSGFAGERAVRTWTMRMRTLDELGFIDIKSGPNGPISYVLIFNPYFVVRQLHEDGLVDESFFNSLKLRMIDVGAHDLIEPPDEEDTKTRPSAEPRRPGKRKTTK